MVLIFAALWASTLTAAPDLSKVLKSVEEHYNRSASLHARFEQTYVAPRQPKRVESGELFLRKPGRMRWEYKTPSEKLFISDGKDVYFYQPAEKRAEKMKLKQADDYRAPLAFLLGKLDFRRDFSRFEVSQEGADLMISAKPASDRLPYTKVDFWVTPEWRIRRLVVTGQDQTVMEFAFTDEKVNAPVAESLFRFQAPPGVQVVETVAEK